MYLKAGREGEGGGRAGRERGEGEQGRERDGECNKSSALILSYL